MRQYQLVLQDLVEEAVLVPIARVGKDAPFEVQQAEAALDAPVADGLAWREAKKVLRKYYLDKAASLRSVNERTYFNKA